jgi:SNF family Na+-dependent transporter
MNTSGKKRERWSSRLGIILAMAGSAVGLGNFLRFPVQAAGNGGGAFMIPYFIAFLLLGVPLVWIEWTAGRYGGALGHGTTPGIFQSLWRSRWIKYFGIIGIFSPLVIFIYYIYVESWLLGYAFFSLTGKYLSVESREGLSGFLGAYQGIRPNEHFSSIWPAYLFFLITFLINMRILKLGVSRGIERLSRYGMPLLLIMALILMVRVLTLGSPDPARPDWSIWNGMGFLWNPDFSRLLDARIWLAAAGQIFFTLSVGIGLIHTYASYMRRDDDVVLSGLTSASTNEFFEIIFGGSLVIPCAFAFFGPVAISEIARSGSFNLGFVTMPMIFGKIPFGMFFATLWFSLLFLAGITSSVSIFQPIMAFLEDEFGLTKNRALAIAGTVCFILCQPVIFFLGRGVMDDLDFWAGTFCLVVLALVETVVFAWIFGIDRAWKEMHHGSDMNIPRFYRFIIRYVTPALLLVILAVWIGQEGLNVIMMKNVPPESRPYIIGTRIVLLLLLLTLAVMVRVAWRRRKKQEGGGLP